MLGEEAFNSFWQARGDPELTPGGADLRRNSVEWSKKMEIHVDFKDTFAFLGLKDTALVNVRASAKYGFLMHLVWVVCAILSQRFSRQLLPSLAFMATVFLQDGVADQCAHIVYVAIHLWFFAPLPKSDADMNHALWCGFVLAVGAVDYGSAYFGLRYATSFDKAMFWGLLLGSIAPGLWFFFFLRGRNVESGRSGTVVRYVGTKKGKGYEHRMNPGTSRALEKDVLDYYLASDETQSMSSEGRSGKRSCERLGRTIHHFLALFRQFVRGEGPRRGVNSEPGPLSAIALA